MYCTKCGAEIPDGSKFCPKCGNPVGGESPDPAVADQGQQVREEQAGQNAGVQANQAIPESQNAQPLPSADQQKKKKSKKPLIIVLIAVIMIVVVLVAASVIGGGGSADRKVVYEGIEFKVPVKWKLDEDSSSDAGLYFYTNQRNSGEMLYMVSVPDVSYILNLFGADYLMDWMTEYIHEQTGGETVDAQKVSTAGYDTYLYDVTGASTDVNGDTVQGGYRIACILNTDKSEMILIYAYGLSAGENDQKVLEDIDYILDNASKTSDANSY